MNLPVRITAAPKPDAANIVRQACILVGGKGTRLGDLTRATPKPLLRIGDDTVFLDLVTEQVARQGFDDIILLAGHLGHTVAQRYDGRRFGSARLRVLVEPEPRGTGGALISAQGILAPQFLLLNGDSYFDINVRALSVEASDHEALIALHRAFDASRYGTVDLEAGKVRRFREKARDARGPTLINGGIYVLRRSILQRIRTLPCSIENDIFPALAAEGKLAGTVCDGYFLDIGLPDTLERGRQELLTLRAKPAVFLDRDGVLNADHGYVHRPEQVEWVAGAAECVRRLNDLGYRVVVATNQAGVGHGFYTEDDVNALHSWMQEQLAAHGAFIDAFYYCPDHPEARVEKYRRQNTNRKPQSGMVIQAIADLRIRREGSFLIGDKESDIAAARGAGLPGFLFSGGNLDSFLKDCLARLNSQGPGG
jgi:D,D-heptose 1,7-bisphosphate phosphatase